MIDRIEELLGSLAAKDEEEQEGAPALPVTAEAILASSRRNEGEAGDSEPEDRSDGQSAGKILSERQGPIAGETETGAESAQAAGELWKDGPVWTVRGVKPEAAGALETEAAERMDRTGKAVLPPGGGALILAGLERTVRNGTAGLTPGSAERAGLDQAGLDQAGLVGLYRQSVRGLRPSAPALPPEQAGITARAQEPESNLSLAVDELDRAVRRDSRRYDGGMSIY